MFPPVLTSLSKPLLIADKNLFDTHVLRCQKARSSCFHVQSTGSYLVRTVDVSVMTWLYVGIFHIRESRHSQTWPPLGRLPSRNGNILGIS